MCDGTQCCPPHDTYPYPRYFQALTHLCCATAASPDIEDDDVGFDLRRIETHGRQFRQGTSEEGSMRVIFIQPRHMVLEGIHSSCGDNPGLTHGPTEQMLESTGLMNERT